MKKTLLTIMVTLGMVTAVNAGAYEVENSRSTIHLTDMHLVSVGCSHHTMTQKYSEINGEKVLIRTHYMNGKEVYIEYLLVKELES